MGRRSRFAGRRAIGRRHDAKMCVLAVAVENRKTFGHRAVDDFDSTEDDAFALLVHDAFVIAMCDYFPLVSTTAFGACNVHGLTGHCLNQHQPRCRIFLLNTQYLRHEILAQFLEEKSLNLSGKQQRYESSCRGDARANKNRWRAPLLRPRRRGVRYFDVNNFRSALDRFGGKRGQNAERTDSGSRFERRYANATISVIRRKIKRLSRRISGRSRSYRVW